MSISGLYSYLYWNVHRVSEKRTPREKVFKCEVVYLALADSGFDLHFENDLFNLTQNFQRQAKFYKKFKNTVPRFRISGHGTRCCVLGSFKLILSTLSSRGRVYLSLIVRGNSSTCSYSIVIPRFEMKVIYLVGCWMK